MKSSLLFECIEMLNVSILYDFGRISTNNRIRRHIFYDYRTYCNDGAQSNMYIS